MSLGDDVDLEEFVMAKDDLSGADIKAVCTEAGLLALRERRMRVTKADFTTAREKVRSSRKFVVCLIAFCRCYTERTRALRRDFTCSMFGHVFPEDCSQFSHAYIFCPDQPRALNYLRSELEISPSPDI